MTCLTGAAWGWPHGPAARAATFETDGVGTDAPTVGDPVAAADGIDAGCVRAGAEHATAATVMRHTSPVTCADLEPHHTRPLYRRFLPSTAAQRDGSILPSRRDFSFGCAMPEDCIGCAAIATSRSSRIWSAQLVGTPHGGCLAGAERTPLRT